MSHLDALAESLIPTAARLVVAVHDDDTTDAHDALGRLGVLELRALCVVLAAMVPDDESLSSLLAWTRGVAPISERQAAANRARLEATIAAHARDRRVSRTALREAS